jgi:2,4-dienoyl-CoA reductase-like NADH-dependent reductase (Old Yellow Enzyme family)
MAFENLLRPGKINGMEMRNRFIAGPMEKAMANLDGTLNERYIHYSRERAKGGVALIQLESIYVRPEGRGNPFQVGCHDAAVIPGLRKIADAIHEHGAKLTMELNHGGRQASITASQRQPIAPSVVPCTFIDPGSVPREMTYEDIEIVIEAFVKAAHRCLEAGVDMIHIHGAHGYLIGQFLSPHSNRRTDEYGGSLKNRARFALEILAALRAVVGKDYPIGYRISAVEFVEGGLEIVIGGRVSQFGLAEDLQRAGVRAMVYKIGDAASPRNVFSASHEAAEVSEKIRLATGAPSMN